MEILPNYQPIVRTPLSSENSLQTLSFSNNVYISTRYNIQDAFLYFIFPNIGYLKLSETRNTSRYWVYQLIIKFTHIEYPKGYLKPLSLARISTESRNIVLYLGAIFHYTSILEGRAYLQSQIIEYLNSVRKSDRSYQKVKPI